MSVLRVPGNAVSGSEPRAGNQAALTVEVIKLYIYCDFCTFSVILSLVKKTTG